MSIATQLTALAANRDAIKAAIEAKGVADAGDTLSEFPAAIASIPSGGGGAPETEPYPWVGSGTHAWLHYDSNSRSHVCQVVFRYIGDVTLDWGDDSATVSLTNGNYTRTVQSHTYADGDFRIDITGNTPLCFGEYTYDGSYHNVQNYGEGFLSDDMPFSTFVTNSTVPRDALIQFETDSPMFYGPGNHSYAMLGATMNMRWIKFTEATAIANSSLGHSFGLVGFFAPKCAKMWSSSPRMPSLKVLDLPSIKTFFSDAGNLPCNFQTLCSTLESFYIPDGVDTLPQNFMYQAFMLKELRFPSTLVGTINNLGYNTCVRRIDIPEGVTDIAGNTFQENPSIESVVLPSTLVSISGANAFSNAYAMSTVVCRALTPPTLASSNILAGSKNLAGFGIWVPQGTISAYEAATNWSQFAGKFHELDANGNIPQA